MFGDFGKAVSQMGDPRFRRVMWIGVALTIALLFGIYALLLGFIQNFASGPIQLPFVGEVTWVKDLLGWGSILLMIFLSFFLMMPVASAFTSMFLEDVAKAVEAKYYPNLPELPHFGFIETVLDTLSFLALLIVANLAMLFILPAVTVFYPIFFWLLNGFLLGREYFQIAAMRRLGRKGAKEMRIRYRREILQAGLLLSVLLTIPVLNLLMPVLGAAMFTHLFHRLVKPA